MDRDSSFLTHAVSAPDFTGSKAPRPRLTEELQSHLDRNLILIVAPAGYGKTTFLADFTSRAEVPVCWVRLSPTDEDPARLAGLVWESFCRRFRRLRNELSLSSEAGMTPQALAQTMGRVLNERVPEPFALIIDDFHLIHPSPEATRFVDSLLTELPPSSTMIVSSRELPRLSLAQWIANDQVKTFGPEELALTMDELNELVERRTGATLDSEIAGNVLAETEGWVTGVLLSDRLVSRALPTLVASDRPLAYDYLAQTAFHRESAEVQTFMARSAVMPIMTAAACNSVLQRQDSQAMLTQLLRKGLFVSATGASPRIYEYHHLFRAFLLEQIERDAPESADELRLAAAEYFSNNDWPEVAFELSMEAGAYGRAATIAEKHVDRLFELGRDRTVIAWGEAIWDAGEMAPRTFTRTARAYSARNQREPAEVWISRGREALEAGFAPSYWMIHLYWAYYTWDELGLRGRWPGVLGDMEHFADPANPTHQTIICGCRANTELCVNGNIPASLERAREAIGLAYRSDDDSLLTHAHSIVGLAESLSGLVESGYDHFQAALAHAEEGEMIRRKPLIMNNIGMSALILGKFHEAIQMVTDGLRLSREMNRPREEGTCLVSLGDIYRYLGHPQVSTRYYREALELSFEIGDDSWRSYCQAKMSANQRTREESNGAISPFPRSDSAVGGVKFYEAEYEVEKAGMEACQTPAEVLSAVSEVTTGRTVSAVAHTEALTLGAKRLAALGFPKEAEDLLDRALRYSEEHETEMVVAREAYSKASFATLLAKVAGEVDRGKKVIQYLEAMKRFNHRSTDGTRNTTVELQGLGSSTIRVDGEERSHLRPLHEEVLFYLVDSGTTPRERLRELFWRGLDPKQQGANANTAIHEIRRLLGSELIQTRGRAYQVSPAFDLKVDVSEFERAVKSSETGGRNPFHKRRALLHAFRLYRGHYLPGFSSPWVLQKRRELEATYLHACQELARLHIQDGDSLAALRVLTKAREIDRYDERLMAMQLSVLSKLGRLPDVVREYRVYVKQLAEDLQLSPSSELKEQYIRITQHRGGSHWLLETA